MKPATTLAEIRKNCSPKPLDDGELDDFFVETGEARDALGNLRASLMDLFGGADIIRRVLVYGHRGCGKSTELNKFREELGDSWFVVHFSIFDFLPSVGIQAQDILLAMAVAIFEAAGPDGGNLKISDKHLAHVHRFFAEVTKSELSTRDAELKMSGGGGAEEKSLWSQLLGFHASIKGDLKVGSRREQSTVLNVRRAPAELIAALDGLIEAVRTALDKKKRRLLIIVEDLDKMNLADAHQVFVENASLLASPTVNLIYTIPLFTFHSSDADAIRAAFDDSIAFPMMEVVNLEKNIGVGYEVIQRIIRKRVSELILDDDAADLLIRGTGGVLRTLFEALMLVSSFRNIRDRPINRADIYTALERLTHELRPQIAWPRKEDGTRDSPDSLFDLLAEIARKQSVGEAVYATGDSRIEVLLRSGALIEYNGGRWLGVHPIARMILAGLGKEIGEDPYGL